MTDNRPIEELPDEELQNITVSDSTNNWLEILPPEDGTNGDLRINPIDDHFGRYPHDTISSTDLRSNLKEDWNIIYKGVTDPDGGMNGQQEVI